MLFISHGNDVTKENGAAQVREAFCCHVQKRFWGHQLKLRIKLTRILVIAIPIARTVFNLLLTTLSHRVVSYYFLIILPLSPNSELDKSQGVM